MSTKKHPVHLAQAIGWTDDKVEYFVIRPNQLPAMADKLANEAARQMGQPEWWKGEGFLKSIGLAAPKPEKKGKS